MISTPSMTVEQTRHLADGRELWKAYGPLLQRKRRLVGGLQWKTVAGNEYLYRYQPDPITKQKRSTSVGRRSPETEAIYRAFIDQRDRLQVDLSPIERQIESYRRVSRALRLNRVDDETAHVIVTLWEDNLHEHMLAFGETAIGAYEVMFGRFLPAQDDGELAFVIPEDDDFVRSMLASLRRIDRTYELIGNAVTGEAGPRVWVYGRGQIGIVAGERLDEADLEVFDQLLDQPADPTVAIARSGTLVPVTAVHPVAHAVWGMLTGDESGRPVAIASLALEDDYSSAGPSELLAAAGDQVSVVPRL